MSPLFPIRAMLLACLFYAPYSFAQTLYKWVDDKGIVHYSATIPPEYSKKPVDEIRGGRVVRRQDGQLTEQEIRNRQLAKEKEAEVLRKEREYTTRIRILRERYPDVESLDQEINRVESNFIEKTAPVLSLLTRLRNDLKRLEAQNQKADAAQVKNQIESMQTALVGIHEEEKIALDKLKDDRKAWIEGAERENARLSAPPSK